MEYDRWMEEIVNACYDENHHPSRRKEDRDPSLRDRERHCSISAVDSLWIGTNHGPVIICSPDEARDMIARHEQEADH